MEFPEQLFQLKHLAEVLILTTGIYLFLRFLRTTRGSGIVRGLTILIVVLIGSIVILADVFQLSVIKALLKVSAPTILIVFVILFQPELRRGISRIGENPLIRRFAGSRDSEVISEVVRAVSRLARDRVGALIAFEREFNLDHYIEGGVGIDATAHHLLIESIFNPAGALHDGAIIVRRQKLAAAACLFPLTENPELSKRMGTRHRAAIGLSEETDAVIVVVSAERGEIGLCHHGAMVTNMTVSELEMRLTEHILEAPADE